MEENQTLDQELTQTKKETPGFLKVLCILTYIACGLGILSALLLIALGAEAMNSLGSVPGMGDISGNLILYAVLVLAASAAGIYGAMQMWKLKKQGFYIYIGSHVLSIVAMLAVGMPLTAMAFVFPIAFIVMYAINLKDMS